MSLLSTTRLLAVGAAAMYCFDPERGRARRARLAEQAARLSRDSARYARAVVKRGTDRSRGMTARLNARLSPQPLDDAQLEARVRSRLGRLVRHPGSIETSVHAGRLSLRGPVLARELNGLMAGLWRVHGLTAIDNQLSVHEQPGRVPGLQGEPRPGRRPRGRAPLAALGAGALACGALHGGGLFRAGAYSTAAALFLGAWATPPGGRPRPARHEQVAPAEPVPPPVAEPVAEVGVSGAGDRYQGTGLNP